MPAKPATVSRCPSCSSTIPAGAKFCPRCGKASPAAGEVQPPVDIGKLPAPLPLGGIVFLTALVLGPAAIVAGIWFGIGLLIYVGIAIAALVVLLLVLGHVF